MSEHAADYSGLSETGKGLAEMADKGPIPSMGRIVQYILSRTDAIEINRRRESAPWLQENWPAGAQAHVGSEARAGDILPMIVVRVWDNRLVNGQVFLDGNDTLWVTSATTGNDEGCWRWPARV